MSQLKRLPQEDFGKLSEDGKRLVIELYRQLDETERMKKKALEENAKANAELMKLIRAKQKEMEEAGELPEGTHKLDADAPALNEWQYVSREWWRLPVCLLTMPEFSLADVVLCAYLIDVTKRGTSERLLSRPHVSERTGLSIRQITGSLRKLTARNLIETTQTGREVKVKLTGAMHLMGDRDYRAEPKEGGII